MLFGFNWHHGSHMADRQPWGVSGGGARGEGGELQKLREAAKLRVLERARFENR